MDGLGKLGLVSMSLGESEGLGMVMVLVCAVRGGGGLVSRSQVVPITALSPIFFTCVVMVVFVTPTSFFAISIVVVGVAVIYPLSAASNG